jgi:hypothetical protein
MSEKPEEKKSGEEKPEEEKPEEEKPEDKGQKTVKAISGLLKAVELAQSKGAFSFKESIEIYEHVRFFKKE